MDLFDKFVHSAKLILDKRFHKDDDLVQEIDKEILAARELLEKVRKEAEIERTERQGEYKNLEKELYTQTNELHRLGRAAQKISLYDYALAIQAAMQQREGLSDASKSKRNVFQDVVEDARKSQRDLNTPSHSSGAYDGTLVRRSQTVYASSAFLWKFMVSSVLETRLLKKLHVFGMLKSQSYMQRKGWNKVLKVCHRAVAEAPSILSEVESELMKAMYQIQEIMLERKEVYEKILKLQRKISGKLKMKQVIQLSTRSLGKNYDPDSSKFGQSTPSVTSAPLMPVTEQPEQQSPSREEGTEKIKKEDSEDNAQDQLQRRLYSAERRLSAWRKKKGVEARNLKRSSLASLRVEESQKRLDSFISFQTNIRKQDS